MDLHTPIPKDIPLPLPVPPDLLIALHVIFFAIHILFVNLMLGGAILTLIYEIRGRFRKDYDALAHEIAKTVTVNKSLAVVMGVGPLLIINLLYTNYFYAATDLIGQVWIMIVPLVIVAFLLAYLHKYSWSRMHNHKGLHITMIATVVVILLSIPLIFLTTINLMLFPDKWLAIQSSMHGFIDALLLPNVLPRYVHFLLASLSIIGLFMVKWTSLPSFPAELIFKELTRAELRRQFYTLAFGATALQFLAGPLVFVSLPAQGMNIRTMIAVVCGVSFAIPALVWMWKELDDPKPVGVGRHYWHIIGAISMTVMFMVTGRHLYRAEAVADHQALVAAKTRNYMIRVDDANHGIFHDAPALTVIAALPEKPPEGPVVQSPKRKDPLFAKGEAKFRSLCFACHQPTTDPLAPSLMEVYSIYKGNPAGIVTWAKAPFKKRARYPALMPAVPWADEDLKAAGFYMLVIGEEETARKH